MATNGNVNHHDQYRASSSDQYSVSSTSVEAATSSGGASNSTNLPQDEVGWYFVEQYYTTLSKSPEKLHLFYSKLSYFVCGVEAEIAPVSHGRNTIQERIKQLDFEDCKVRISNVDSQASSLPNGVNNIVIQVIGEISNKGGEPKKFVQTFVLAQQPSGYFVLNDILRYIKDEDEDEAAEAAPAEEEAPAEEHPAVAEEEAAAEQDALTKADGPAEEPEQVQLDAAVVDKKLEEIDTVEETPSATVADTPAETTAEVEPAHKEAETVAEEAQNPEKAAEEITEEEAKKPEVPVDPSPTPIMPARPTTVAPAAAEPEKPKEPPKHMTWASRAAAAAGTPRPAVPVIPKAAAPSANAVPRTPAVVPTQAPATAAAAVAAAPASTASATAAQAAETPATAAKDQGSEWETAQTKRQNRPQSLSTTATDKESTMAYIKYVTEKVKSDDLRAALAHYGELAYFDINRQKNCAFVEFATQAGYNAAVAANPHVVNGENIIVEQRRPKANAYGGSNYNATRGGTAGRGRGGFDGRSASQSGGRGGFGGQTRGRGGGGPPRGRGASQVGNV